MGGGGGAVEVRIGPITSIISSLVMVCISGGSYFLLDLDFVGLLFSSMGPPFSKIVNKIINTVDELHTAKSQREKDQTTTPV